MAGKKKQNQNHRRLCEGASAGAGQKGRKGQYLCKSDEPAEKWGCKGNRLQREREKQKKIKAWCHDASLRKKKRRLPLLFKRSPPSEASSGLPSARKTPKN